ncbi:MAG: cytochrome c3 family protein [Hyphomicrobiaceae bacterium]
MSRTLTLWTVWLLATAAGAVILAAGMVYGGSVRSNFAPGRMTSGHHQIELACTACHTSPFSGREAMQKACIGCHGADLATAKDSHPAKKFNDPRNADRLAKLKATECVTCHTEHRPEITRATGLTLPADYCALCHQDIGRERPSHVGLDSATCLNSGCHNYHDNRALYEDFLEKHAREPDLKSPAVMKLRATSVPPTGTAKPITSIAAADAPPSHRGDAHVGADWLASAHAKGGVNCAGCHAPKAKTPEAIATGWIAKPDHQACTSCHEQEGRGFVQGRHGMRLAAGMKVSTPDPTGLVKASKLGPMQPSLARLPMAREAHAANLTCTSCHQAHAFATRDGEVKACLGCHADEHSKRYIGSPHHKAWLAEVAGKAPAGSGVTCAGCHMPRIAREDPDTGEDRVFADHNQNNTLRPASKMIRPVCMSCHGLGFAIDALADRRLVESNFAGRPSARVESITWVMRRLKEGEGKSNAKDTSK